MRVHLQLQARPRQNQYSLRKASTLSAPTLEAANCADRAASKVSICPRRAVPDLRDTGLPVDFTPEGNAANEFCSAEETV